MEKIIAKIVEIEFDKFHARILKTVHGNVINYKNETYYFGNIGSYLIVQNAVLERIVCEVVAIKDTSNSTDTPTVAQQLSLDTSSKIILKPLGTLDTEDKYSAGVSIYPSLYNDVFLLTHDNFKKILTKKEQQIEKKHANFEIGQSKNLLDYRVELNINDFFAIHSAVLGNSGSGKSNTIASILQTISKFKNHSAHGSSFVLFDVNGEYREAFNSDKLNELKVKYFKAKAKENEEENDFSLPHHFLNLEEWCAFLLATQATQRPFWDKVLKLCYLFHIVFAEKVNNNNKIGEEDFTVYFKHRILTFCNAIVSSSENATSRLTSLEGILSRTNQLLPADQKTFKKNITSFVKDITKNINIDYGKDKKNVTKYIAEEIKKLEEKDNSVMEEIQKTYSSYKKNDFYNYKFIKLAAEFILLEEKANGNSRIGEYVSTMMARLDILLNSQEYSFLKKNEAIKIDDYLKLFLGFDNQKKENHQLSIIDLSEMDTISIELISNTLSRMIFDFLRDDIAERNTFPVHLILDEAHRYLKKENNYHLSSEIFEKIAREGRKFGLFLILSSQRPSELNETILSQCSNFIIHRIQNEIDIKYVSNILPFFSIDYMNKIKIFAPGEVLIFGQCTSIPLYVQVNPADPEPKSKNCDISNHWFIKNSKSLTKQNQND